MQVKIKKWGNSLATRLPKSIVELSNFRLNQTVDIEVVEGHVVLSPTQKPIEYSLDQLLVQCNPDIMELNDEDKKWLNEEPVGREAL